MLLRGKRCEIVLRWHSTPKDGFTGPVFRDFQMALNLNSEKLNAGCPLALRGEATKVCLSPRF